MAADVVIDVATLGGHATDQTDQRFICLSRRHPHRTDRRLCVGKGYSWACTDVYRCALIYIEAALYIWKPDF